MKPGVIIAVLIAIVVVAFGIYMIDFDVSGEAELPDVDVSVEGGALPEVDAEVGEVELGTEERTVEVPTIEVTPPEDDGEAEPEVQN